MLNLQSKQYTKELERIQKEERIELVAISIRSWPAYLYELVLVKWKYHRLRREVLNNN